MSTTPELTLPRGYLSISQIEMYIRCPRSYYFRYIKGIVSPPSIALVTGSSGHAALEMNFRYKANDPNRMDAPVSDVMDAFSDEFDVRSKELDRGTPLSLSNEKDRTYGLLQKHQEEIAPSLVPESADSVEQELKMEIGGIQMLGYADLVTTDSVVDHKFVGKVKSAADANNSLQLTFYAKATGKDQGAFNCLVKSKLSPKAGRWSVPKVQIVPGAVRTDLDYAWLENVVKSIAISISAGVFPPTDPCSWACSEKFCGFWHMCRGATGGASQLPDSMVTVDKKIEPKKPVVQPQRVYSLDV